MTEVTARTTKAKTAKYAPTASAPPTHGSAKSDLPNMETPQAVPEMAAKGVADANTTREKAKVAAEHATDPHKNTHTAAKGVADYNLKLLEIARANTSTAFDYAHELLRVKSLPELIALSTAHSRKQLEAMTAQTKELTELAVKATAEIAEPLKTGMTKAFGTKAA
jgi:phasin